VREQDRVHALLQARAVADEMQPPARPRLCDGTMSLRSVQQRIAANWQALYKKVYRVSAAG
jgi:hypothetical protein